jgi:hypothetical protein
VKANAISFIFSVCLAVSCPSTAFSQDQKATETASSAPVADVYVQTLAGVMAYSISSSGAITEIAGSPFDVSGQMEANNGKYLIGVGSKLLHAYKIESNGAVGGQVSSINTHSYAGSQCGLTSFNGGQYSGSVLDNTGKYLYVHLYNFQTCDAWQSYKIGGNGSFTFLGDEVTSVYGGDPGDWATFTTIPTIGSTDKYAYSIGSTGEPLTPFAIASSGALKKNAAFSESDPEPLESWQRYETAADPHGHLAVVLEGTVDGSTDGPQLASYTIHPSTGSIASTNTPANMPDIAVANPHVIRFSDSGSYVAVGGYEGLQVFHSNGAAPATAFGSLLLPTEEIDEIAWDSSNHLYALSYLSQQLYVYTVTSTKITEVAGYPFSVPNSAFGITGMIVVSK